MHINNSQSASIVQFRRMPDRFIKQGDKLMMSGNFYKALLQYKEAERIAPDDFHTSMALANCYINMSVTKKAIGYAFKVISRCSEFPPELFSVMGVVELERMHYNLAYIWFDMYFEQAANPDPSFRDMYDFLLSKTESSPKLKRTLELIDNNYLGDESKEEVTTLTEPNTPEADNEHLQMTISDILDTLQEHNQGDDEYEELFLFLTTHLMLGMLVAQKFLEQGKPDKAIQLLEKLAYDNPENERVREILAYALFCQEKYDEAIDICKLLVAKNQDNIGLRCNLMVFLYNAKRFDEVKDQVAYLRLKTQNMEPFNLEKVILALMQVNELEFALELQIRFESWVPYNSDVIHRTAMCYIMMNDIASAQKEYLKLLGIDENDSVARYYYDAISEASTKDLEQKLRFEILYTLPVDEILRRLNTLSVFTTKSKTEYRAMWEKNEYTRLVIRWSLREMDSKFCIDIIDRLSVLANVYADRAALSAIEEYLTLPHVSREMVDYTVKLMTKHKLKTPLVYTVASGIYGYVTNDTRFEANDPELFVDMLDWEWSQRFQTLFAHKSFKDAYRILIHSCLEYRNEEFIYDIAEEYEQYVEALPEGSKLDSDKRITFAAAFELHYCIDRGLDMLEEQEFILMRYGISKRKIVNAMKKYGWMKQ
ncbi:MAG: tetratricopeptide repeat protein [Clostridia bacterium]|nr:tetratricopeptide repeat protein [Clostridia bacterium]